MASEWYYFKGDQRHGPLSSQQLRELASDGTLERSDSVWKDGMSKAVPAEKLKGLFDPIKGQTDTKPRSRVTTDNKSNEFNWYYTIGGQHKGPVQLQQLLELLTTKQIGESDRVWNESLPDWIPASEIPELSAVLAATLNSKETPTSTVGSLSTDIFQHARANVNETSEEGDKKKPPVSEKAQESIPPRKTQSVSTNVHATQGSESDEETLLQWIIRTRLDVLKLVFKFTIGFYTVVFRFIYKHLKTLSASGILSPTQMAVDQGPQQSKPEGIVATIWAWYKQFLKECRSVIQATWYAGKTIVGDILARFETSRLKKELANAQAAPGGNREAVQKAQTAYEQHERATNERKETRQPISKIRAAIGATFILLVMLITVIDEANTIGDLAEAHRLWDAGDYDSAMTKYKAVNGHNHFKRIAKKDVFTVYSRMIAYEKGKGNSESAEKLIERAHNAGVWSEVVAGNAERDESKWRANEGKKFKAFQAIPEKFKGMDRFESNTNRDKRSEEINQLIDAFDAIPFNGSYQADEAKKIIDLWEKEIENKYSGASYRLVEDSVGDIIQQYLNRINFH